jgi:hypothetical protein
MSDTLAPPRARTATEPRCHGGIRDEPQVAVQTKGASDTSLLESQFYGCCVPQLYNQQRPHSSLGYLSPAAFARTRAEMTA